MYPSKDEWMWANIDVLYIDDEVDVCIGYCPYCGKQEKQDQDNLQTGDYATHVMWWGYSCCGKYAVIDCKQSDNDIIHPLLKKAPGTYSWNIQIFSNSTSASLVSVPMLYIKKMVNRDVLKKYKKSTGIKISFDDLSDEEKIKFIDKHGVDVNDWDPCVMEKRGYCMDHDGIYIHLLCTNIYGEDVLSEYWGD